MSTGGEWEYAGNRSGSAPDGLKFSGEGGFLDGSSFLEPEFSRKIRPAPEADAAIRAERAMGTFAGPSGRRLVRRGRIFATSARVLSSDLTGSARTSACLRYRVTPESAFFLTRYHSKWLFQARSFIWGARKCAAVPDISAIAKFDEGRNDEAGRAGGA